ncbi:MAG: GspH/FimT family pseudopilin [Pseudomonadota bacterium]
MQKPNIPSNQSGFTLVEVFLVVVIIGILGSYAVPAFREFFGSAEITRAQDELANTLRLARSSALGYSKPVIVCSSSDGNSCKTTNQTDWTSGWIVFLDCNEDGVRDVNDATKECDMNNDDDTLDTEDDTEQLVKKQSEMEMTLSATVGTIEFDEIGRLATPGTFTLTSSSFDGTKTVAVNGYGRVTKSN